MASVQSRRGREGPIQTEPYIDSLTLRITPAASEAAFWDIHASSCAADQLQVNTLAGIALAMSLVFQPTDSSYLLSTVYALALLPSFWMAYRDWQAFVRYRAAVGTMAGLGIIFCSVASLWTQMRSKVDLGPGAHTALSVFYLYFVNLSGVSCTWFLWGARLPFVYAGWLQTVSAVTHLAFLAAPLLQLGATGPVLESMQALHSHLQFLFERVLGPGPELLATQAPSSNTQPQASCLLFVQLFAGWVLPLYVLYFREYEAKHLFMLLRCTVVQQRMSLVHWGVLIIYHVALLLVCGVLCWHVAQLAVHSLLDYVDAMPRLLTAHMRQK